MWLAHDNNAAAGSSGDTLTIEIYQAKAQLAARFV
jgi:hypothetical protein